MVDGQASGGPAWFDEPLVDEPRLLAPDDLGPAMADVVVVGLGASGLEGVLALARLGVDVIGVDAVGVAAGAAGANGGFLLAGLASFHHDAAKAVGHDTATWWYRRSMAELDRLAKVEPTFDRCGSRRTPADDAERVDIAAQLAALRSDGIEVEPTADGGLWIAGDGSFHPVARCRRLALDALAAGARLVAPAAVVTVEPGGVVLATGQRITGRQVLVAVDGGLEQLLPGLVGRVTTARLEMLATAPDVDLDLRVPRYHRRGYDYAQQRADGRVFVGGGRDLSSAPVTPGPMTPEPVVQSHLDGWLGAMGGSATVTHRWVARAAFTQDRLPVVLNPSHPASNGAWVIGAYSGHGNVLGGLLARKLVLQLLDGLG